MSPSSPGPDFAEILSALVRRGVSFVIAGGVGAVLQGAPINTFDLDIVHRRDDANIARLIAALREMGAVYRLQPERKLEPDATHLRSPGHQLLMTRYGPLDLSGTIGHSRTYEDLMPGSIAFEVGPGIAAYAAGLADIIAAKEEAGGEKDAATLPILRRTNWWRIIGRNHQVASLPEILYSRRGSDSNPLPWKERDCCVRSSPPIGAPDYPMHDGQHLLLPARTMSQARFGKIGSGSV